ncbi:MAG TPA: HDOD domain-containing protein [Spirochaetota bacterium]|nr:HDOD domain-containing protein [Spirochaetota bacterium]
MIVDTANTPELISRIEKGEPVTISFIYPDEKTMKYINSLFSKILSKIDLVYLLDTIITIQREIIINAAKANAKRVFFKKLELDIHDPESYQKGIDKFKNDVVGDLDLIKSDLQKSNLKIKLSIQKSGTGILMTVTNNAAILPEELERIQLRMNRAKEYNDFSEAYDEVYDSTEGAGLGIVLVTLLLKNSGIGADSYTIKSEGDLTKCNLTIPFELKPAEITTNIKNQILELVQGLPTFPENIIQLQRLCGDPQASINEISDRIMLDPSLTSDVLKLSNSAGFITGKRIEKVSEAVVKIGLKNLNSILTASSARRILDTRFSKFEQVWSHCNKTAFYSRAIAMKFRRTKILENVFLAGLLHDLGKIVLLSTNLDLTNWIADIVDNRKIRTSTIMEEISIGISHPAIGELISNKWSFPEYLTETIRHHHSPTRAKEEYRDQTQVTYLANMLCGVESRKYDYSYVEESTMDHFGIKSPEELIKLHEDLKTQFDTHSKTL